MARLVVQAQRVGKIYRMSGATGSDGAAPEASAGEKNPPGRAGRGPRNGRRVLHDIDLSLRSGDTLALTGPSGSGKSTLMHILGALDPDFHGEVEIMGEPLRPMGDAALSRLRNRHIGFVFQGFHLLGHLTALENVLVPAHFAGLRPDFLRAMARLERVGLAARARARPQALSGGERQRVAFARALFMRPALLLCDEPTGNLDAHTAQSVMALLAGLAAEGTAWIVVTHDMQVAQHARRRLRLEGGQLVPAA